MAQSDYSAANDTAPAFRADLNTIFNAIATMNSGTSAPSTTFANMFWYDETNDILKVRNEADDAWISWVYLDQTNDEWRPVLNSSEELNIQSDDAGATMGPIINLVRNSASPADSDIIGGFQFKGEDDASNSDVYALIQAIMDDVSSGTEDGQLLMKVIVAGTLTNRLKLDAQGVELSGIVTQPDQPAFHAYSSSNDSNVTGDNTLATVDCDTEVVDQGNDFAADTLTTPVNSLWLLIGSALLVGLTASESDLRSHINTSNTDFNGEWIDPFATVVSGGYHLSNQSEFCEMDALDTATWQIVAKNGSKVVDINRGATYTSFKGAMIC